MYNITAYKLTWIYGTCLRNISAASCTNGWITQLSRWCGCSGCTGKMYDTWCDHAWGWYTIMVWSWLGMVWYMMYDMGWSAEVWVCVGSSFRCVGVYMYMGVVGVGCCCVTLSPPLLTIEYNNILKQPKLWVNTLTVQAIFHCRQVWLEMVWLQLTECEWHL